MMVQSNLQNSDVKPAIRSMMGQSGVLRRRQKIDEIEYAKARPEVPGLSARYSLHICGSCEDTVS